MKFKVTHITKYDYENVVAFCHNRAMLKPRDVEGQRLLSFSLEINPEVYEFSEYTDFFGNNAVNFLIQIPHDLHEVKSVFEVERDFSKIIERLNSDECKKITFSDGLELLTQNGENIPEWAPYRLESKFIPLGNKKIKEYALQSFEPKRSIFEATKELNERIYRDFEFKSGATEIITPVDKIFDEKKGVCQDFTQVAISCLRSIGLPARYVSGYIETIPPEGQEKLIGADASHAWFSVFIPNFGWVDFDPTNNQIPADQHITLAWGRDYGDIVPLKGVIYSAGKNTLSVSVDVSRI